MVRSERGYVGMRTLVALGVVTALVWMVPIVFLSKRQADLAAPASPVETPVTAPVATPVTAPVEPSVEAPAAVTGADAGGGVTSEVATDPVSRAKEAAAQSLLSNAMRVAQVWYASSGSFEGFDAAAATEYDPGISFSAGPPTTGTVTITATANGVVMVTMNAEQPLCAALVGGLATQGRVAATTPEACQGGW